MQPREPAGNEFGLVRLQVADEMPVQIKCCKRFDPGQRFLNPAFGEITLSESGGGPDHISGMSLADGNQPDIARQSAAPDRRGINRIAHRMQAIGERHSIKIILRHQASEYNRRQITRVAAIASHARKLGSLLDRDLLARLGVPHDFTSLPDICAVWQRVAPKPLSRHVHPARFVHGELTLHAEGAVWASQIRHARSALIASLRREPLFRSLTELQVRVRPRDTAAEPSTHTHCMPSLSKATRSLLQQTAEAMPDPDLRAALLRLAKTQPVAAKQS